MQDLIQEIEKCIICQEHLPLGPRPVISLSEKSEILIVGQAPGLAVHKSGVPWDDKSGERLRKWLGVDNETFYNKDIFGIVPMGFCYPGRGKSGDLPPRKECAPQWHSALLDKLPNLKLILLIGTFAQKYYLKEQMKRTLTETVIHYNDYLPNYLPLPHPSPRNNIWMKKNQWFEADVIPVLQNIIKESL